jgi:hypothetical protein
MKKFKRTIEGRDFIFEYLPIKQAKEFAYLVSSEGKTFEMEMDERKHWKIVTKVTRDLLRLEADLGRAIRDELRSTQSASS